MTEDALASDRRIGMVAVRAERMGEMAGDPPLYATGCAGFIAEHQRLADGRFHLLLRALHRFRIVHELPREPGRLYRVAEVEPLSALAEQLVTLKSSGPGALAAYRRNVRLKLFSQASRVILEDAP